LVGFGTTTPVKTCCERIEDAATLKKARRDEVVEGLFFNPTRSLFSNAHQAVMVSANRRALHISEAEVFHSCTKVQFYGIDQRYEPR